MSLLDNATATCSGMAGKTFLLGSPTGVYSWKCSDCNREFYCGIDKPQYCPLCGVQFDNWKGWE